LHMSQLMPLPLTVSCFSKIQIGFTFLVPAHPGSPEKRTIKRVCVCVLFPSPYLYCMPYVHLLCLYQRVIESVCGCETVCWCVEQALEKQLLVEQCQRVKQRNAELAVSAEQLSAQLSVCCHHRRRLDNHDVQLQLQQIVSTPIISQSRSRKMADCPNVLAWSCLTNHSEADRLR